MTTLAQAYIHLKPYPASDRKVRSLGRYAQRLAIKTAADIYGGGVEIEVQIEEGSLITRITVAGGLLLGAYGAIRILSTETFGSEVIRAGASQSAARLLRCPVRLTLELAFSPCLGNAGRS